MKNIVGLLSILVILSSCKTSANKQEPISIKIDILKEKSTAVCILKEMPVLELPNSTSNVRSTITLGEKLSYSGEYEAEPSGENVFYKVQLSDGMLVWVNSSSVVLNSEPAAIKVKTMVYERPDLKAKLLGSYMPMEFVAITSKKEDWLKVIGLNKTREGWIQKQNITVNEVDIATSTLAYDKLIANGLLNINFIDDFLDELPYQNSCFVPYLQEKLDREVERAIENAIEEYERIENVMLD